MQRTLSSDGNELRFAQVSSAYSVHPRYASDTELFLESAHMNLDILRHDRNEPCDHCDKQLQHDVTTVLKQCTAAGKLWEYSQILHGKAAHIFKEGNEVNVVQELQVKTKTEKNKRKCKTQSKYKDSTTKRG